MTNSAPHDALPPGGRTTSAEELDRLWEAWTPGEVAERLAHVQAPWCVAGGWAIDLYLGGTPRLHADIEIAVPRQGFPEIADALPGFEWDVAGAGRLWPYADAGEHPDLHQTWCRDPASGRYHLDVFREPHDGNRWMCRRDPSITLPYGDVIGYRDGVPYLIPEVALLFKARRTDPKDQNDFERVAPRLTDDSRARLAGWITRLYPDHTWLRHLAG
ncbi:MULTISPECIES: nucleotidyltransferase domain-containing protein [unclassified Mycolicibacterium]|uniref:nucleotidyltransferase domain-containing protein n=1 Tax=unclassified Mycolicibacterium TaxID=2636767 RepID=UPI002ED7FA27